MESVKKFLGTLQEEKIITKREWLLTLTTCTLAGILAGILCSPKKFTMIGSHNGCNSGNSDGEYHCTDSDNDMFEDDCWE